MSATAHNPHLACEYRLYATLTSCGVNQRSSVPAIVLHQACEAGIADAFQERTHECEVDCGEAG